jgi:hypothetical protein
MPEDVESSRGSGALAPDRACFHLNNTRVTLSEYRRRRTGGITLESPSMYT